MDLTTALPIEPDDLMRILQDIFDEHPELTGDLGDPGLAQPRQDGQDGERTIDRLHTRTALGGVLHGPTVAH